MSDARFQTDDPAYQDGYDDACSVTNELVGTLIEDVENYHRMYQRIAKQYEAHMRECSRLPKPEDWPPPLVQGESQELPGFADVAERPADRYPT